MVVSGTSDVDVAGGDVGAGAAVVGELWPLDPDVAVELVGAGGAVAPAGRQIVLPG